MRYLIELSYKGASYHGWQIQPNAITIQETLENALKILLKSNILLVGSSRTDAGVHAEQQFAHFDYNGMVEGKVIARRLNKILPKDIAIHDITIINDDFHARYNAKSRSYEYRITSSKDPFLHELSYYYQDNLDIKSMNIACDYLLNVNNFKSFSKVKTGVNNYLCHINHIRWIKKDGLIIFQITANRFLRGMVRALGGCLFRIGQCRITKEDFINILLSEDRTKVVFSLPPQGLFLTKVNY